jgi:nucleotide-binding universal stress UspA family protein
MKVLVPVDDSLVAPAAVDVILSRDWPIGTIFKVITVIEILEQILPGPDPQYIPHARIVRKDVVDSATRMIKETAARIEERFGASSVRFEVLEGLAADLIVEASREWPADLIVMSSHGRHGLAGLLLGSVARTVALKAPCSVEIVRRRPVNQQQPPQEAARKENVLVAVDLSPLAQTIIEEVVLRRQWAESTRFQLLSVLKPLFAGAQYNAIDALRKLDEWKLTEAVTRLHLTKLADLLKARFSSDRVTVELLEGPVQETIISAASRWPADLIVTGAHGRRGMALCLLGSTSQAILSHAPCSVLVVKAKAGHREEAAPPPVPSAVPNAEEARGLA